MTHTKSVSKFVPLRKVEIYGNNSQNVGNKCLNSGIGRLTCLLVTPLLFCRCRCPRRFNTRSGETTDGKSGNSLTNKYGTECVKRLANYVVIQNREVELMFD